MSCWPRLHALARRPRETQSSVLCHGSLALDLRAHSVSVGGQPLPLTPREFALLWLLLRHRGRTFTRIEIFDRIATSDNEASDKSIEVLVFGLRRKLGEAGLSPIETRRGAGYLIPQHEATVPVGADHVTAGVHLPADPGLRSMAHRLADRPRPGTTLPAGPHAPGKCLAMSGVRELEAAPHALGSTLDMRLEDGRPQARSLWPSDQARSGFH